MGGRALQAKVWRAARLDRRLKLAHIRPVPWDTLVLGRRIKRAQRVMRQRKQENLPALIIRENFGLAFEDPRRIAMTATVMLRIMRGSHPA
jgi:hypothetical protein